MVTTVMPKNILIDTHVFLWALAAPHKLTDEHVAMLTSARCNVYVSSISVAELCIKSSIGKLKLDFDPIKAIKDIGFEEISFTASDAVFLKDLPFHHKDPFDRMLITQAISNNTPIMSYDEKFKLYECGLV